ncbi:30S ribosomal protein S13 [bacterium]|nr:30S ribosomal protein S13 [bacterium]
MARIHGVDLPKDKKVLIGLTYIYGIGRALSIKILKIVNVSPDKRAKDLTEDEISKIASIIQEGYEIEGSLRRNVASHIRRLIDISSYRGTRHRKKLPARGQRTKTNARTRKGPKRIVMRARQKESKESK